MQAPDEIIHQSTRLRIMAALAVLPRREKLEFTRLRALLATTDGNLGAHLSTLEKAGYVEAEKDFVARKPRTRVAITAAGRAAYAHHVAFLRAVIEGPDAIKE